MMSGEWFDCQEWRIEDMADKLNAYIYGDEIYPENIDEYLKDMYISDEDKAYIKKHGRTPPNWYEYDKDTIKLLKKAEKALRMAHIYAVRVANLMSGDDGEESFKKRLKEDMGNHSVTSSI